MKLIELSKVSFKGKDLHYGVWTKFNLRHLFPSPSHTMAHPGSTAVDPGLGAEGGEGALSQPF
jgi:hypothetical protein